MLSKDFKGSAIRFHPVARRLSAVPAPKPPGQQGLRGLVFGGSQGTYGQDGLSDTLVDTQTPDPGHSSKKWHESSSGSV